MALVVFVQSHWIAGVAGLPNCEADSFHRRWCIWKIGTSHMTCFCKNNYVDLTHSSTSSYIQMFVTEHCSMLMLEVNKSLPFDWRHQSVTLCICDISAMRWELTQSCGRDIAIKMDVPSCDDENNAACLVCVHYENGCVDVSVNLCIFYEESLNPGFYEHAMTTHVPSFHKRNPLRCSILDMFSRRSIFRYFQSFLNFAKLEVHQNSLVNVPCNHLRMVLMKPRIRKVHLQPVVLQDARKPP